VHASAETETPCSPTQKEKDEDKTTQKKKKGIFSNS
jgi:hypothetical protein